mmetsp:Transcript_39147/g.57581  ORF Transcript_39147/g.57581 Transcript_39147/m.57581 type:complete len:109 (-) Transcript_39147:1199-1525(-)
MLCAACCCWYYLWYLHYRAVWAEKRRAALVEGGYWFVLYKWKYFGIVVGKAELRPLNPWSYRGCYGQQKLYDRGSLGEIQHAAGDASGLQRFHWRFGSVRLRCGFVTR